MLNWGSGNFIADPGFLDPDGNDNTPGNEDDNLRLQQSSPCVDSGDDSGVTGVASDLDGNPRVLDGNADGIPTVDMGAYEVQRPIPTLSGGGFAILFGLTLIVGALLIRARVPLRWDAFSRRLSMRPPRSTTPFRALALVALRSF